MPEGDTIHKLAAAIRPRLVGRTVLRARIREGPGRTRTGATAGGTDGAIEGHIVQDVYARGKHLLVAFDNGLLMRTHLGMYGSWHRYRPGEPWRKPARRATVALWTEQDVFVCFNAREVELAPSSSIRQADFSSRLGPDLLGHGTNLHGAVERAREFAAADTSLVDLLLDQRIACGIGNVYKSEILFLEKQFPLSTLGAVADEAILRLYRRARSLLLRNLGGGRRITRFAEDGRGTLWVYGRRNFPCLRCGTTIRCAQLGKNLRSTYWCPACQGEGQRDSCNDSE